MLFTPSPCHKLSHLLGPPTPASMTYFMDGPYVFMPHHLSRTGQCSMHPLDKTFTNVTRHYVLRYRKNPATARNKKTVLN